MKKLIVGILASFSLMACGGGGDDGVDGDKSITELTEAEISAVCESTLAAQGGPGHVEQCDGYEVEVETQAECEASLAQVPAACSGVTVAEAEACSEDFGADLCAEEIPASCVELFECSLGG
jgi:hypothetical protein